MLGQRIDKIIKIALILIWSTTACSGGDPMPQPAAVQTLDASPPPSSTAALPKTAPAATTTLSPIPFPATATPAAKVCSPLQGLGLSELHGTIHNPFNPPPPGSDNPHYGVDFADLDPNTGLTLEGREVQAVLPGKVALVIKDRFPYGNAVLIETSLASLPGYWLELLEFPSAVATLPPNPALTCPTREVEPDWDPQQLSLFLLYAHLQEPPTLNLEDPVSCGQPLGKIGGTGNALNPHLHLEARAGPAGAQLEGMAHYDSSASEAEMSGYCSWRVSGWFQVLDPMKILLDVQ